MMSSLVLRQKEAFFDAFQAEIVSLVFASQAHVVWPADFN